MIHDIILEAWSTKNNFCETFSTTTSLASGGQFTEFFICFKVRKISPDHNYFHDVKFDFAILKVTSGNVCGKTSRSGVEKIYIIFQITITLKMSEKKLRISVKYKSTQERWNFLLGNIGDSPNMQQQYLFSNFDQKRTKM